MMKFDQILIRLQSMIAPQQAYPPWCDMVVINCPVTQTIVANFAKDEASAICRRLDGDVWCDQ